MNDFQILAMLIESFGDRMYTRSRYYAFDFGHGAYFYIQRRFPTGFEPVLRFRESAIEKLPGGRELGWYLESEDIPREWRGVAFEYVVEEVEQVEAIIEIILNNVDLADDWVEAAA